MNKSTTSLQKHCFNCDASIQGAFCYQCGQRARDNSDRSLGRLLGEVFNNIFFFDNRFFISAWYLVRFPGRMTVEFLEGKRKKFISPITLFLFFNLVYFLFSPLSDYSISLYDQIYSQPYSKWTKEWVDLKLQTDGLDERTYAATYQNASDNVSKSIMILNIPMIAIFIYLLAFKKRRFYFDSLIYVSHLFSLFMLSWILLGWVGALSDFLTGDKESIFSAIFFILLTFVAPLFYAILSIKEFMNIRWYWAIPAGMFALVSVGLVNMFYRFIILIITFWTI